jgi:uncharacterized membrane protein
MAIFRDPVRRVLTPEGEERVLAAIRKAEECTSGEIRVHIEWRAGGEARHAAERWFERLRMTKTAERNGILFYLAVVDRKFAVIGDEGIHRHVGEEYWKRLRDRMHDRFEKGDIAGGLEEAILDAGRELQTAFPRSPTDKDELPDTLSYGEDS